MVPMGGQGVGVDGWTNWRLFQAVDARADPAAFGALARRAAQVIAARRTALLLDLAGTNVAAGLVNDVTDPDQGNANDQDDWQPAQRLGGLTRNQNQHPEHQPGTDAGENGEDS